MARRFLCLAALVALLAGSFPASALADHEDGWYEMPARSIHTKGSLVVWIMPPVHGQIANDEGVLNDADPNEATPFNSYLRAIEASIKEWSNGVRKFGSKYLRKTYKPRVYVVGRDDLPSQDQPDILVTTDENKTFVLGFAFSGAQPCIVNNSMMMTQSFTYADMFNVNAQEYGHCLGLGHVGSQGGVEPTSDQKHPEHDVMNGFYADSVGAAGTHLHCVSNLNVEGLEYAFRALTGDGSGGYTAMMHVDKYDTTCGGDGRKAPRKP